MPSLCANLSESAPRLAAAQREFWLAWKAVEAGDRMRFKEARRAMRGLEQHRTNIQRHLYAMWTPKALERVEKKKNIDCVGYLRSSHDDDFGVDDLQFLPDGQLLMMYQGARGSRVERRSFQDKDGIYAEDVFDWHQRIERCVMRPDKTLVFISRGELYIRELTTQADTITRLEGDGMLSSTLHVHYDGRIFAGSEGGD